MQLEPQARRRYCTVDVFSDRQFGGNPLAVVLDAAQLSTAQMQAIAAEFNYSETTFVLPPADPAHAAQVRIFTPRTEVPFAGHPNVGTAFVLARNLAAAGAAVPGQFLFDTGAAGQAGAVIGAELQSPQALTRSAPVSLEAAAACLSLPAAALRSAVHAPVVASVGLPFLVAEVTTRSALAEARPDAAAHARILPGLGVDGIYAYVRGQDDAASGAAVLHARMFAPLDGVPEDPATGSATAAALALLAELDPSTDSERRWRVHQGDDMGRPSVLLGTTTRCQGRQQPVRLAGRCVPVLSGVIKLTGAP
jgi:trans-2,3-dihydro-3-hydroxyanthranilate isomerase